ncbi:MAG TPA: glycosyltransferase [Caulobacteraceae bacterium]|nr:glycosyltransferase [Caulobacteraceae bacterium]
MTAADDLRSRTEEALALFREGRFDESTRVAENLIESHGEQAFPAYIIGRNLRFQGKPDKARRWLRRSTALRPAVQCLNELACAEEECRDILAAAEAVRRALEIAKGLPNPAVFTLAQRETARRIAQAVRKRNPGLALAILRPANELGLLDRAAKLALIEILVDVDRDEATKRLAELQRTEPLDAAGWLLASRLHELAGKRQLAIAAAAAAAVAEPGSFEAAIEAAERLIELGHPPKATHILDQWRSSAGELTSTHRVRFLRAEYGLAAASADTRRLAQVLGQFQFSQHGRVTEAPVLEAAVQLAQLLEERLSGEWFELSGLLRFYTQERMADTAERLLERAAGKPGLDHPQVIVRRLALHCYTNDLDAAERIYDAHLAGRPLDAGEQAAAIRFLAERKRWREGVQLIADAIERDRAVPGSDRVLLKLARQAGAQIELLDLIDRTTALPGPPPAEAILRFRQQLVDDLCMDAGIESLRDLPGGRDGEVSEANRLLSASPGGARASEFRTAIFLCTDPAYFLGLLVFLSSYAAHNPKLRADVDVFVFLSDAVPNAWEHSLDDLGKRLGLPLAIIREANFVPNQANPNGGWGFFSGGWGLSRAAYFRLYAAKFLQASSRFQRLLYIDSDICCRGDLEGLLEHPMGGAPLAARREERMRAIETAARANGINPDEYFNSGVLLFDLEHPETEALLEESIRVSEAEDSRLFFLDQCALNIAFKSASLALEPEYNFYIRPSDPAPPDYSSARLVHFIAAPKPWDLAYDLPARELWMANARLARLAVPDEVWRQAVLAANGRADFERPATPETDSALTVVHLANGREVAFPIRRSPGAGACFVLGVRKSGSTLLNAIARPLAEANGVNWVEVHDIFFRANVLWRDWSLDPAVLKLLAEGNAFGGFRGLPPPIAESEFFAASPKILMVRDPRDALVSDHFSLAYSHPVPAPESGHGDMAQLMLKRRAATLKMGLDESVSSRAHEFVNTLTQYGTIVGDPMLEIVRYEDVITDKKALVAAICRRFSWTCSPQLEAEILAVTDVFPEVEDPKAFIRRVLPGEHKEKLAPETIAALNLKLGPVLDLFGYPR